MDFNLTAEDTAFREEIERFLRQELPTARGLDTGSGWGQVDWRGEQGRRLADEFVRKVAQKRWNVAGWPKEHGGLELDFVKRAIIKDVMAYYRAPSGGPGPDLIGPIIMTYGSDIQKGYHLQKIRDAEERWCQFFSEPDAGSDLANTQVTAVADGDDYIVNGVKVWHDVGADWGAALVRTDPEAPKHRGISFLLVRCDAPGLNIQPLVDLADGIVIGKSTFDNVRVPRENLVGEENRGWYVAMHPRRLHRMGPGDAPRRPARHRRRDHQAQDRTDAHRG
jgi:alkylation response protein AidB-like acyl-CoA dehydrogenase